MLSEKQNATFCVEGPRFGVARDESEWVDLYARQTDCLSDPEVRLPSVRFDAEIGVAAWWKVAPCLGYSIHTESVEREAAALVVRARSGGPAPGQACASALGALESFLAVRKPEVAVTEVRFVLDGKELGQTAPTPS